MSVDLKIILLTIPHLGSNGIPECFRIIDQLLIQLIQCLLICELSLERFVDEIKSVPDLLNNSSDDIYSASLRFSNSLLGGSHSLVGGINERLGSLLNVSHDVGQINSADLRYIRKFFKRLCLCAFRVCFDALVISFELILELLILDSLQRDLFTVSQCVFLFVGQLFSLLLCQILKKVSSFLNKRIRCGVVVNSFVVVRRNSFRFACEALGGDLLSALNSRNLICGKLGFYRVVFQKLLPGCLDLLLRSNAVSSLLPSVVRVELIILLDLFTLRIG